jgi:uncharacterized damage-inducible protein DinB
VEDNNKNQEMNMVADFSALFRHLEWANRRMLELLQSKSEAPERARRLFAHVLAAEQVWLTRLRGEDSSSLEIWPDLSLEKCATLMNKNIADYRRYLETLSEKISNITVTYRNSKGVEFHNSVGDILRHVSLHGSYHRGQIAQTTRNAGLDPIVTDFIAFAREGIK